LVPLMQKTAKAVQTAPLLATVGQAFLRPDDNTPMLQA
jgi:hypothetical protein